ncbi:hypothetical protein GCM10007857_07630 [Bradyrhizobium iriomotense]|uniref:Uncharacterized protein n=1 Tax=Bradyrhizobium iriomotense TaxID=441950 RepID=A0ABQ6AVX1_9BRAD|nr:hypothetical protein GCM10007857_07630 [Bradyrhizobium iriomotense]
MPFVALDDDGIKLYLLGRNIRRRKISDRTHLRIEGRLNERISKCRMSRRDRGCRLGGNK